MTDSAGFLDHYGPPCNGHKPLSSEAAPWRGRVPDDLIAFWLAHGTVSYSKRNFWVILAPEAEAILHRRLGSALDRPSIVGLDAHGQVALWTRTNTHLMLDVGAGLVMDMTSLGRTAPFPHDAPQLAEAAGLTVEDLRAAYLQQRDAPEDFWAVLSSLASDDARASRHPSVTTLERKLGGPLAEGEHFISADGADDQSWRRTTLIESLAAMPSRIRLVRYETSNDDQVTVETTIELNR